MHKADAMDSVAVFDAVARGEMTPSAGAQRLTPEPRQIRRPNWMPFWVFIFCVIAGAFVLGPLLSARDRQS